MTRRPGAQRELDRRIAALAVPALGSIAAEPLYTLVDTAIVGHLGREPRGGGGLPPVAALTLRFHWLGLPGIWAALGLWLAARSALLGARWRKASRAFGQTDPDPERTVDSSPR